MTEQEQASVVLTHNELIILYYIVDERIHYAEGQGVHSTASIALREKIEAAIIQCQEQRTRKSKLIASLERREQTPQNDDTGTWQADFDPHLFCTHSLARNAKCHSQDGAGSPARG
jgi:hypothetical protein